MYEYKCVPGPTIVSGSVGKNKHIDAVLKYQNLINEESQDGWEFNQIDTIESHLNPGCFGGLLFQSAEKVVLKLLIFKRLKL